MFDVIIVGGGPAGLSAALLLGRCRRSVLLCYSGKPRNSASRAMHGFLTRDGIDPLDFLREGRDDISRYENVKLLGVEVTDARTIKDGFEVTLNDGNTERCRKLLLATGVIDELPPIDGIENFYGRSVFLCPYCDGWENRDQSIAVYGYDERGHGLALKMLNWSKRIVLCTDGKTDLSEEQKSELSHFEIPMRESKIQKLQGDQGALESITFVSDAPLKCSAMFFALGQKQHSHLPAKMGCEFNEKGAVKTGDYETTCIPGLYVAGDASGELQMVIVAVAEGAKAGFAINTALQEEDKASRYRSP